MHHVEIAGGTIRVIDRASGQPREIRMASVDAELHGFGEGTPVHLDAKAGFESTKHNVVFQATSGRGARARRRAQARPRRSERGSAAGLPAGRERRRRRLTFEGRLATKGETWNDITNRVSGGGEMTVVSGAITGHNFIADVVQPVLASRRRRRAWRALSPRRTRRSTRSRAP